MYLIVPFQESGIKLCGKACSVYANLGLLLLCHILSRWL